MAINRRKNKIEIRYYLLCAVFCLVCHCGFAGVRDSLASTYTGYLGVREATGQNDGIEVEKFLAYCGFKKGTPWCAAFVYACHIEIGMQPNVKQPAFSPSWFADESKITYRKSWTKTDYKSKKGQVFGLYFSKLGRVAHVGFIDGENATSYFTIEGNTNGSGSREGDGIYRKTRNKNTIHIISDHVNDYEKSKEWRRNTVFGQ